MVIQMLGHNTSFKLPDIFLPSIILYRNKNTLSSKASRWPIVDYLILEPYRHLVISVHRIVLACCLLVIIILILIIHYRCVSIVTLQHTQHQSSYQDRFKSIPTAQIERSQCAGSRALIQQNISFTIAIVVI